MKNIFFVIVLAITAVVITCCKSSEKALIKIPIEEEYDAIDINNQVNGDVRVLKGCVLGDGYTVIMFHDHSGKLQEYRCYIGTTKDFDEAEILWKNDTTISVTLTNAKLQEYDHFEMFSTGQGTSTGMRIDD